jgi:hypothetical protein
VRVDVSTASFTRVIFRILVGNLIPNSSSNAITGSTMSSESAQVV